MARGRLAVEAALIIALLLGASASAMSSVLPAPMGLTPAAAVGWPPSTGLLLAEVVTGGPSASDEFVEITNAGPVSADLLGLEIVYVTASGGTVTRKVAWTASVVVQPGRHVLIANALGAHAGVADATYSGGLAATGGAMVLRPVGGAPVDALGWGDAANGFVEGTAAPAPMAGSSIERKPGALGGNLVDTNSNGADVIVNTAPAAQNLAAPPAPVPSPSATSVPSPSTAPTTNPSEAPSPSTEPSPTASPSVEPTATATATPDSTASPTPTASGTEQPTLEPSPPTSPTLGPTATPPPSPAPTPEPTPAPSATPSPTPSGAPSPSPAPSMTPSASPIATAAQPVADARLLLDGTSTLVEGVLTTDLGVLETGRAGFVQDASGGIAIYLDAVPDTALHAGTTVRLSGTIDTRYGQRTLRTALADVHPLGVAALPAPLKISTGGAGEVAEGLLVEVSGTIMDSPVTLADGTAVTLDDGSGGVRVIVAPDAGPASLVRGSVITARGPLGQRDSSGTGLAGYRVLATMPGDLFVHPAPSSSPAVSPSPTAIPSPSPSASPSPSPTPSASPGPSPSPSPSASPSASPSPSPSPSASLAPIIPVAQARTGPIGKVVRVRGTVTAEPGRVGTPALFAIQDATGGIVVKLPADARPPARGTLVEVRGPLADPYGQLEVRPPLTGYVALGGGSAVAPLDLGAGMIGQPTEALLARVAGTVTVAPKKATSGDITFLVASDGATLRVMADASAAIPTSALRGGDRAVFTGVVGQRASAKGAVDGYRLWVRDGMDIAKLPPQPTSSASPGTSDAPPGSPLPSPSTLAILPIAQARLLDDAPATVQGVVTAGSMLFDASGRRVILDDGAGAIEVLLPVGSPAPRVGDGLRAIGIVGRAYGAVRIRATAVEAAPGGPAVPLVLGGAPGPVHEWRLVRLSGTLVDVRRLGDRWVAELQVGTSRVPVTGLPGAGIPSTAVSEGRHATVTGIVRRPYPSASDRRFAVVPRSPSDLAIGPAGAGGSGRSGGDRGTTSASGGSPSDLDGSRDGVAVPAAAPVDIDLGELAAHLGALVRVGGLVTHVTADGVTIDDGTALGRIVLRGTAAELLPLLEVGDALNAIGRPSIVSEPVLIVDDPAGLRLVGALGEDIALASPSANPEASYRPGSLPARASVAHGFGLDVERAGLGTLAMLAALSVVATGIRRHRARQLLQARIVARLEALAPSRPATQEDRPES